jgi:hypothetical protein
MTATNPPGVLLLLQQGLAPIEEAAALAALPDAARSGRRETITIDLRELNSRAIAARDWHDAGRMVVEEFRKQVQPKLASNVGFEIAYFGSVSITLAVQLGFLSGTWARKSAHLFHHRNKDWRWPDPDDQGPTNLVKVSGLPNDKSLAEGDIVVRVSTSHLVEPEQVRDVISRPLADVEIRLENLGEDAVSSPAALERIADEWKRVLDGLHEKFPNARAIHLFASVQVAVAFMLGARINPRIHAPVQTYQYESRQDPRHYPALLIEEEIAATTTFTAEEVQSAVAERARWQQELDALRLFAKSLGATCANWLEDVVPPSERGAFCGSWLTLPRLTELHDLLSSRIDLADTSATTDGFAFSPENSAWAFSDSFLVPLMRQIPDEGRRRRAARLFFLHEGLHAHQRLTTATSRAVGRFAKILEEIDYQADVWALLHERAFSMAVAHAANVDPPALVRELISVAVETMQSFDVQPGPLSQMQVRRVARYLIWAWQQLETERLPPTVDPSAILSNRPLIELAGAEIRVRENRVWFLLDPYHLQAPEIAVYHSNKLYRFGDTPALPMAELIEALRRCDAKRVRAVLRGVFDLVVPARR